MTNSELFRIVQKFLPVNGPEDVEIESIESGLINTTFKVHVNALEVYILQRINKKVFENPVGLQENVMAISDYLIDQNYSKTVLCPVQTERKELLHIHEDSSVWRMLYFIPQSHHFNVVPSAEHAFEAAKALGEFHQQLADFDSRKLMTPIQGFLDFQQRRSSFEKALEIGDQQRRDVAKEAIEFIQNHVFILDEYQAIEKLLPTRVIHGDPKISNFLFKDHTTEVLALIDWDTIMQGSILYDFGDMVRSFTNRKEENDCSVNDVFNADFFDAIKRGYMVHQKDSLTPVELDNLFLGAKTVIYIQAMRFLTDYLLNDIYFKSSYENQNLDRTKNQIQLLEALLKSAI